MKVVSFLQKEKRKKVVCRVFTDLEFASKKCQNFFKSEGCIFFLYFFLGLKADQESEFWTADFLGWRTAVLASRAAALDQVGTSWWSLILCDSKNEHLPFRSHKSLFQET